MQSNTGSSQLASFAASSVAHKIVLNVSHALEQGKNELLENFQKRVSKARSQSTIYTHMLFNKDGSEKRMETPGEAINRYIREIGNPVYSVVSINLRNFRSAY